MSDLKCVVETHHFKQHRHHDDDNRDEGNKPRQKMFVSKSDSNYFDPAFQKREHTHFLNLTSMAALQLVTLLGGAQNCRNCVPVPSRSSHIAFVAIPCRDNFA